jgi:beta-fructofuranosidase
MSLPRVLTVGADGHLSSEPLPELRSLRRSHQSRADLDLQPGVVRDLGVHGAQVEIVVEFDPVAVGKVGLAVRASPGGEEETLISYNFADDQLEIDCRRSSLDLSTNRPLVAGPLRLPRGEPLQLHVFLDASVIEIFANGRAAAARVYPRLSDSLSIRAFNCPPSAYESLAAAPSQYLRRVDVWELDSIWEGTERIPPDG